MYSEYIIAHKLRMTHRQLLREMGPGELPYWLAYFELESEQYEQARRDAEKKAKGK